MANVTLQNFVYPNRKSKRQIDNLLNGPTPFPENGKCGILLHGPYGTSKTTAAELIVDDWRAPYLNLMATKGMTPLRPDKLDCRINRNIASIIDLEEKIKNWALAPLELHYIIVEEVDLLDVKVAAPALSSLMDKGYALFVMTTNNLSAVDKKTVGRCHVIDFHPENADVYINFLKDGLKGLGVLNVDTIPLPHLRQFCSKSGNNIRDIIGAFYDIADEIDDLRAAGTIP